MLSALGIRISLAIEGTPQLKSTIIINLEPGSLYLLQILALFDHMNLISVLTRELHRNLRKNSYLIGLFLLGL